MSVQVTFSKDSKQLPEHCQIFINGRLLFKKQVAITPPQVLISFLKSVAELCERSYSETHLEPLSVCLEFTMLEGQRIQIKVKPHKGAKVRTALKEEWTDVPRLTIDIFSQADRCLAERWEGWPGTQGYQDLSKARAAAQKVYWQYLQKRRGAFDVADDKRPTQGAGPRDVDRSE